MELTQKQRLFADEYIKSGNATHSYILAGYNVKSGGVAAANANRLLKNANVKEYIEAKMAEIESRKIADAKEAMQSITAIARGEATETQAQLNPLSGEWEKIEIPADLKTRLAAWKEILKRYPLADEFAKAQLRKTIADARISEARAKTLEDSGTDIATALDKVMDKLIDESDKSNN